ncbi:MAG: hypothetical protein RMJ17_02245 [Candidatus Aenigmarchaeota archaeon]|nr:hypothetical protein [Candidatus Aenigmarchaeota archaeon]MDW8149393.1 hypothetical protein [Candidatus Aenigmarchaeota archaeon]
MENKRLLRTTAENTIIWIDLEGVLIEVDSLFYLMRYKPNLAIKSILKGAIKTISEKIKNWKTDFRKELIRNVKKEYEEKMSQIELYIFGRRIFDFQSKKHKENLVNLMKTLKKYDIYIVTYTEKHIAKGFLDCLPAELRVKTENIISSKEKEAIIDYLKNKNKNKKIVGIGDSYIDEKALERSDVACILSSYINKVLGCKIKYGYKFNNLAELNKFFIAIYDK